MDEFADLDLDQARRALHRERAARLEAEQIAERSIRRLYDANLDLDRRVDERTRQLEDMREREARASGTKSRFLANLSHEVRTPLNGIIGMLELLDSVELEGDAERWLDAARDASGRLDHLFVRLLRFVDLEAASERTDRESHAPLTAKLSTIIERVAERWTLPCARRGQLLTVDAEIPPGLVVEDPAEVMTALDELVSNAATHAEPGAVRVSCRLEDDGIVVAVLDAGPGYEVDQATLEILQPGGAASERADLGAGLGLPIASRCVDVLGGEWGVNATGSGTRAWFRIPRHDHDQ